MLKVDNAERNTEEDVAGKFGGLSRVWSKNLSGGCGEQHQWLHRDLWPFPSTSKAQQELDALCDLEEAVTGGRSSSSGSPWAGRAEPECDVWRWHCTCPQGRTSGSQLSLSQQVPDSSL